jgi:membrane-bound serine protease (ClpP class)
VRTPRLFQIWPALFRGPAARLSASLALLILSFFGLGQGSTRSTSVPAARQARNVAVITIRSDSMIDRWTAHSVVRRLELAHRAGADAVVIDLDTPGGDVYAVLAITAALKNSPVANTVAWVNPRAYSGGAIIAWACREIVASPSASVGDALPIMIDPSARGGFRVARGDQLKKILPPLMADLVESARKFGRDEYLVQALVNDTVRLWLVREKATGRLLCIDAREYQTLFGSPPPEDVLPLVPAVSPTSTPQKEVSSPPHQPSEDVAVGEEYRPASPELARLAHEVDQQFSMRGGAPASGRPTLTAADRGKWEYVAYVCNGTGPIVLKHDDMQLLGLSAATIANDEELKAFFGAKNLIRFEPSWSEGLVAFLSMMPVQGVLLVLFLLGMFIEMTHPGTILPGMVAFIALAGLVAPPLLINLSAWWAVAAILVGIVLVVLEVLVIPGFGVFGIMGLLLLLGGLVGVVVPSGSLFPDSPTERRDLLYGMTTVALALATSGAGMYFIAKHFGSLPLFNRLVLQEPVWDDESPRDDLLAAMGDPGGPVKKGMTGVTVTPLRPAGRVEIGEAGAGGRIIDVVAEIGYIPAGCRVRVVSVSDFRIGVERSDDPAAPGNGGSAGGERTA